MFDVIKNRFLFYTFSLILVLGSIFSIFYFGFNLGIDLKGGSILNLEFKENRPEIPKIEEALKDLNLNINFQPVGEKGLVLKMKDISEETHQKILEKLNSLSPIDESKESFQTIGPSIGKELQRKTNLVIILCTLSILFYVSIAFRKVSRPVPSFYYALFGTIALCHDVLISSGLISILGKFKGVEFSIPIITALLTIFGYSINDTVVVYDRIRENLTKKTSQESFEDVVKKSINQSFLRSFNTSFTTILPLIFIYFLGGESLKYFALTLIVGIAFGTYSSLFLAPQLIVDYYLRKKKNRS